MTSTRSDIMIIGASVAGMSVAACLHKLGVRYTIIEKESAVAMPWRLHYDRLHLHTPRNTSHLPHLRFPGTAEKYPSRVQVVDYLESYQRAFGIEPLFNVAATRIFRKDDSWQVETPGQSFSCRFLVVATGTYHHPRPFSASGLETFPGTVMHSSCYRCGRSFKGKRVVVVGFGNSACEIAMDLSEHGARPALSVRSPVNVIPRDILGIPILSISAIMQRFPPQIADKINRPLLRL
ncbi:MAG TPA: NAD(P)/FAD-dependent oxidoreductase, partial [Chitinophagaceae bacterium]